MRPISRVAPDWWDYTTLDPEILNDSAKIKGEDLPMLSREGFEIRMYDSLADFYLAEAARNTSPPGNSRRPTIRWASAAQLARPNNCRSSPES